jgi:hypothetical protein
MAAIVTRETAGTGATVKNAPLTNADFDNNLISLNTELVEKADRAPRITSISSSASIQPNSSTTDQYNVTALAEATAILAPTGSPVQGQKLLLRLKDNGTARGIVWTTSTGGYRQIGALLPVTTVISKTTYVGCVYNASDLFWDVIAVTTEA